MRFSTALITAILVVVTFSGRPAAQAPGGTFVTGEILVKFRPGATALAQADVHRQNGGRVLAEITRTGVQQVAVQAGDERGAIARYQRNPNVLYAEPNFIRRIPTPTANTAAAQLLPGDFYFKEQWALHNIGQEFYCFPLFPGQDFCFYIGTPDADIDAPEAWAISTGSPVLVAVIDSGVDYTHPDIAANYAGGHNYVANSSDPMDDHGHGTHVSGTIAGEINNLTGDPAAEEGIVGVAPHARILAYKVCAADGTCDDFAIAEALAQAVTDGARVINMSLGGTEYSQSMFDGVQDAWNAGLVVVAAAGNDGSNNPQFYPANYPNVISVGAFDEDHRRATFSNFGDWVDIAAPGNVIMSSYPLWQCVLVNEPGDTGCYTWLSGTSMAAPHVSGAAALVWSRTDVTSNAQVVNILLNSADPQGVDSVRLDSWTIHGGLNVANAMSYGSTNLAPVANAGPDQTVLDDGDGQELVALDGSGSSDADGSIMSYDWREGGNPIASTMIASVWLGVGTHTLTLQVTDNDGNTGSDTTVVTVQPAVSPTGVHIGDLDGSSGGTKSTWTAQVSATVHDSAHQPVSGAVVSGSWSGGGSGSSSCTTGAGGTCLMSSGTLRKRSGSVTFTVTGVNAGGLTYSSAENHDPDGDSTGTALSIAKP